MNSSLLKKGLSFSTFYVDTPTATDMLEGIWKLFCFSVSSQTAMLRI